MMFSSIDKHKLTNLSRQVFYVVLKLLSQFIGTINACLLVKLVVMHNNNSDIKKQKYNFGVSI